MDVTQEQRRSFFAGLFYWAFFYWALALTTNLLASTAPTLFWR